MFTILAVATAVFVGIVMTSSSLSPLERFGAQNSVGRVVSPNTVRELAPSLTALVVGCRIGAGIAAELGSMAVTEQIDAIRALGADPVRKLVVPRVPAGTILMSRLTCFALVFGIGSAMLVSRLTFGIPMPLFLSTALDTIDLGRRDDRRADALVTLLGVGDLALSSSARWLRHPSLAEPAAASADLLASLDVDPAGALLGPPAWREAMVDPDQAMRGAG